ncbi:MAG: hypothetical protein ACJ74Y_07640 [Bryobacteraceae bacterium]
MLKSLIPSCLLVTSMLAQKPEAPNQRPSGPPDSTQTADTLRQRNEPPPGSISIAAGTRILLSMINSVSTKQAVAGDRIYLETAFPVLANGHIVVPEGSWVTGTITEVKRPGRVKGRGELQVRFDSITLPNGVSRDFRADLGAIDARDDQKLKREDSKISGPGDKSGDLGKVVGASSAGTVIGSGVGAAAGNAARGAGIGSAAGAASALAGVLLTRGPDATLTKGSTVEMLLDRPLVFQDSDLDLRNAPPRAPIVQGNTLAPQTRKGWSPIPF